MRSVLLAISIVAIVSGGAVALNQVTGYGQIAFDNRTSITADVYLDESYACRAHAGLTCTTHAQAGTHIAEFRFVDGDVVTTDPFYLQEGDSITVPVTVRPAS